MAKDLPYFKFDAAEWINGSITLESLEVQGLFINICAHYWFKSGSLSLSEIKRRLSAGLATAFDALIEAKIIGLEDDMIRIGFLDEQLAERRHLSEQNSANGRLGGRKKATALMSLSETKANQSNIEERREEKRRQEEITRTFFSDQIFLERIGPAHRGKDFRKAFDDCYAYHAKNADNWEIGDWQKKFITWISKVKADSKATDYKLG